jgi:hypothetical protein
LFDRELGLPTDEYGLDQAVADGFLVPFRPISVPLRFPREGIRYDALSDEEKAQWDLLDWEENVLGSGRVESGAINSWLFNADTVDKGLQVLMTQGCRDGSGDHIGKSVIFARNHKHAEFIRERFDHHYPHLAGKAARVIDNEVKVAQSLIDDFANPAGDLRIAISVDMLDTGIDIPEIVNLVFFKPVRSRTKFWQMVGRGTRPCNNLFGPGRDKQCFWIFDLCQNLEFFLGQGGAESTAPPETLSTRLFNSRLAKTPSAPCASTATPSPSCCAAMWPPARPTTFWCAPTWSWWSASASPRPGASSAPTITSASPPPSRPCPPPTPSSRATPTPTRGVSICSSTPCSWPCCARSRASPACSSSSRPSPASWKPAPTSPRWPPNWS